MIKNFPETQLQDVETLFYERQGWKERKEIADSIYNLKSFSESNKLSFQSSKEEFSVTHPTIEALEEKLQHAMLTSDVAVLDELIADDLVWTMHTGFVGNKQADLEAHRTGVFKYTKLEISDRQIHCFSDDCAVVTLRVDLAGIFKGQAFSEPYRFTRVWLRRQNHWQIAAGHVSQIISIEEIIEADDHDSVV